MNNRKTPKEFPVVELAVAAVAALDGSVHSDMDFSGIGESPSDLDLVLPVRPDNRHAAETWAARARTKGQR